MIRKAITSSAIAAVGYDDATQTLEIVFLPNKDNYSRVWRYSPVDRSEYETMIDPASVGTPRSAGKIFGRIVKDVKSGTITAERMPDEVMILA